MRIDGGILTYQPNARHLQEENTPKGRRVVFLGKNGSERDQQKGRENLEVGEVYRVEEIYVDRYSSEVRLQECPRYLFNTVMFEDYEPEEVEDEADKVKVTKEQLDVIEGVRDSNMDALFNLMSKDIILKKMRFQDVVKVYNGDYEIEEPTPQFEPGDLAMYEGRFITLDKWHSQHEAWTYNGAGWFATERNLKKPTQDEIFWLHDLKRDCVNDFRTGDVLITKDFNEAYVMSENAAGTHNCTINDALTWVEQNNIKAIYPNNSRKSYRKGES